MALGGADTRIRVFIHLEPDKDSYTGIAPPLHFNNPRFYVFHNVFTVPFSKIVRVVCDLSSSPSTRDQQ